MVKLEKRKIGYSSLEIGVLGLGCAPLGGNFVDLDYAQGAGAHNAYLATQSAGNSVAMGLDYGSAMKAITSNPAEIFGLVGVGSIAPGFDADLVVWDGDPLELMSNVENVLIDGMDQDLSNRYEELTERYTKEKELPNSYRSRE